MKPRRRIPLLLLMVLSQLTLTAFVGWWIGHQYRSEKALLKKELNHKFLETERQVTDSVIFKNYIQPLTQEMDSVSNKQVFIRKLSTQNLISIPGPEKKGTVITVKINDTSHTAQLPDKVSMLERKMLREMMVGMKMFISNTPGDTSLALNYQFSVEADSTLFKRLFKEKTDAMGLKMAWVNQKEKPGRNGRKMLFYSAEFDNMPAADISGYNVYLLKKIWPQMVFGVLLVLLTATAFVIAYRNIRAQQRLNMIREDFISNISHELKTPLSTAKVTIEALKTFDAHKRAEVMQEYLDIADNELERLDELVTKVLRTGMLENGNGFIHLRETELTTLVYEAITAFRIRTRDKNVEIRFNPDGPLTLPIDPLHVQGVLYNLLDNAVKYHEGNDIVINISIEEKAHEVLLKVSDNGVGIHPDYQDKVFDKFFRVPSGNIHNVKGHGLGLSYTQQVMLKHGGKVTVHNNPDRGCTFVLYFPKKA